MAGQSIVMYISRGLEGVLFGGRKLLMLRDNWRDEGPDTHGDTVSPSVSPGVNGEELGHWRSRSCATMQTMTGRYRRIDRAVLRMATFP
jgi:hypothetical protein